MTASELTRREPSNSRADARLVESSIPEGGKNPLLISELRIHSEQEYGVIKMVLGFDLEQANRLKGQFNRGYEYPESTRERVIEAMELDI